MAQAAQLSVQDTLERQLATIATDFGVPIEDVTWLSRAAMAGGYLRMPMETAQKAADAARRCFINLGDTTSYVLYQKIRQSVAGCHG